jgi:hypothetical protein
MRMLTAWSAVGTAVLWSLVALFVIDFLFQREVQAPQRAILLLIAVAAVTWAYLQYAQRLLSIHESEVDMALLVERQQQIESDLVAAIQFEDDVQGRWGSRQLEMAVIDYVGTVGHDIDVYKGFDRSQFKRRVTILAVTAGLIVLAGLIFPGHVRAFVNRLGFGSLHYPSATAIKSLAVNGRNILVSGMQPQNIRCAEGRGVEFILRCEGSLPEKGLAQLSARERFERTGVEISPLTPEQRLARLTRAQEMIAEAQATPGTDLAGPWFDELSSLIQFEAPQRWSEFDLDPNTKSASRLADETQSKLAEISQLLKDLTGQWPKSADAGAALYVGHLPRLNEPVRYRVTLGDAYTDTAEIAMIALPAVEAKLTPIPPKYAAKALAAEQAGRQAAVLVGSEVQLAIQCTNNKPLKEAWIIVRPTSATASQRFDLQSSGTDRLAWSLPAAKTPFERVNDELRYEIQVTDEDGLHLETPIKGSVRIRADKPPIVVAQTIHRVVLPMAKPSIIYRAGDDFGLHRLAMEVEVERHAEKGLSRNTGSSGTSSSEGETAPGQKMAVELTEIELLPSSPLTVDRLPLASKAPINLGNLKLDPKLGPLEKGDRLKVVLIAQDDRGGPGETFRSEPLIIEVSDELGVLSSVGEPDPQAAQRLDEIIKREFTIGESK